MPSGRVQHSDHLETEVEEVYMDPVAYEKKPDIDNIYDNFSSEHTYETIDHYRDGYLDRNWNRNASTTEVRAHVLIHTTFRKLPYISVEVILHYTIIFYHAPISITSIYQNLQEIIAKKRQSTHNIKL